MKIVVIGGTGLIGSKVVEKLKQKGHEAIAAAPSTGVNTITGEGLAANSLVYRRSIENGGQQNSIYDKEMKVFWLEQLRTLARHLFSTLH